MANINFPESPSVGQAYTFEGKTWSWNGYAWDPVIQSEAPGYIVEYLDDLKDVDALDPYVGMALVYDGNQWKDQFIVNSINGNTGHLIALSDIPTENPGVNFNANLGYISNLYEIRFLETTASSDYVSLRAPSTVSSGNVVFTLPGSYPPGGSYVLSSTVSGILIWVPQSSSANVGVTSAANDALYNLVFTDSTTTVSSAPLFIDNDSGVQFNPSTNSVFVSGNLAINGGTITSTATTFNLLNTTVTNANVLGAAETIQIGSTLGNMTIRNAATDINGSLRVAGNATFVANIIANGGTITSTATTFNLLNTTVTNANVLGAARTIVIGAATGATTTVRGNLVSTSDFTVNSGNIFSGLGSGSVFNFATGVVSIGLSSSAVWLGHLTSSSIWLRGGTIEGSTSHQNVFATALTTTVSAFSSATDIKMGADFGATYIKSSTVYVGPSSGSGTISTQGAYPLYLQTGGVSFNGSNIQAILTPDADGAGQFRVTGGDLYLGIKTDAVLTDYPVNIVFEGTSTSTSKTTLTVSGPTANRTVTIPDATGTLALVGGSSTQIIFNDGGSLGGDSGLIYSKTSSSVTISGNLAINGGTITSTATTFNLLNTTVTNANVLGSANVIQLGGSGAGGSATIRNAATAINGTLTVTGATVVQGALSTNSTLSVTGNATFVANILANGGTITSTATTFNLLNTTVTNANIMSAATTVNAFGAAVVFSIGSTAKAISETVNIFSAGTNGGTYNFATGNSSAFASTKTVNIGTNGVAGNPGTNVNIGQSHAGTSTIISPTVIMGQSAAGLTRILSPDARFDGNILAIGGTITSTATTFNLLNTTVTNANVLGAANTILLGGTLGSTTIRNAATSLNGTLSVTGNATFVANIIANGGTITSIATTFNLLNTTVTNANVLGAADTIVLGGTLGSLTIRNLVTTINGTLTAKENATFISSIVANGGTITSTATTFDLLNTTVTNANVLGDAGTIVLGSKDFGSITIRNAATAINGTLTVTGATVVQGTLSTNSTLSVTSDATFIANILANGGTITSTATTFNLLNTTVTNANVLGAANTILLGGTLGSTTIRNAATAINGTLTVTGAATFQSNISAPNIVNSVNGLTGTVVSPKTYLIFSPLDNQPPASNFATIDTRNSIMVLEFDAATDESAVFVGVIPEFASLGSGLKVRIHWMADTATSGTCRWGVQIERMNTDLDSDSFDTAATAGSTTNATSGIITTTEITITTIDGVTAGDPFRLKVYRDADGTSGTDDMLGDAQLVVVEIRSGV